MDLDQLKDLPRSELFITGRVDRDRGVAYSPKVLLVAIGAPRLRTLGFELPFPFSRES